MTTVTVISTKKSTTAQRTTYQQLSILDLPERPPFCCSYPHRLDHIVHCTDQIRESVLVIGIAETLLNGCYIIHIKNNANMSRFPLMNTYILPILDS